GLARDADVFVQGYRPGAVKGNGFGPEEVARVRPGIVYVSLSAYGHEGPWASRRGFDSLVQNVNGTNHAEAEAAGSTKPKPLPCQAIDHATGYLMAFGAMVALARRAKEGGSWHVRVSLAQTGHWMRGLGRIDGLGSPDPGFDDVRDRLEESASGFGKLITVRHAATMSETSPRWARSAPSPSPVPNRANACAKAVSGTAQVGIEQPSMPHASALNPTPVRLSSAPRTSRCTTCPALT